MAEKELLDGLIEALKVECEKCTYFTEVYKQGKITQECSQKECEFNIMAAKVIEYLEKHYKKLKKI